MAAAKKPFHETVAENLIEQLKAGTAPWQRPYEPGGQGILPVNPTTGKRYKGINAIHLMGQGREDSRWMTYNQAKSVGAQVRKGETGTAVQYWKFTEEQNKLDGNGKPVLDDSGKAVKETVKLERPRVFFATVFNAEQIDGLPKIERKEQAWDAIERADHILQASGASISHGSDMPFYRPSTDSIHMPDKAQFPSADKYYATALHELGHWTGHPSRLDRDLSHPFGSEGYAKEELRAEIASMVLGDELSLGRDPGQHAAYVKSWVRVLENDPLEIFRAAAEAEKISEFVLSFEQKQVQEIDQSQEVKVEENHNNLQQQAVELAQAQEERVKNDPISTEADISEAQKNTNAAEAAVKNDESDKRQNATNLEVRKEKERTYINVPFNEKDEAKSLGARWDRQERSWYVPPTADSSAFSKWTSNQVKKDQQSVTLEPKKNEASDRLYLAVPYGERGAAKAAGAKWDKDAKSWYVGPSSDMSKLSHWLPENVPNQQGPAMTPTEEFKQALISLGCVVPNGGNHPIMDGKKHRIPVEGDKKGEKAGFYVAYLDDHPAGYIKNNRTGVEIKWKSKGYELSPEQKAKLNAEAAEKLATRAKEQERAQEAASQSVVNQAAGLTPPTKPTTYLKNKGVGLHNGVLTDESEKKTYIPAYDTSGKQWTMQYINEDGTKRFAKDSRKEGCFHVIGGLEALEKAPALVLSEGYATAATNAESLGFATVVAFDSGNLPTVAAALHNKYPEKPVVILGDDDRHQAITQGTNPGRDKANEAAKATGGKAIFPVFAPGEADWPADLDKVTPQKYREHLQASKDLESAPEDKKKELASKLLNKDQIAALDRIKSFSDFNDLATKSSLGRGGVERQVKALVNRVVQSEHKEQQQAVQKEPRRAARIS
ncbi:zincin-like metallopeptidase domain-containing protein [Hahella ganghwensis]|uniref:zincin-like metallopeptidase domain-containing protein n=1 Tax=Hahella ganghwensis TaxID=286420 RepID=UPI00037AB0D0|nr:zincin-like metallopeptidase domain-containing protein [Hahella ganghwensis]